MIEVKECPFCGKEPQYWSWDGGAIVRCYEHGHIVKCEADTLEEAIQAWNKRVDESYSHEANFKMTIDDAIKHIKEVIEENTKLYKEAAFNMNIKEYNKCKRCVTEHTQLLEWLNDYKKILGQQKIGHWVYDGTNVTCSACESIIDHESRFCPNCGTWMKGSPECL